MGSLSGMSSMDPAARQLPEALKRADGQKGKKSCQQYFQMPLHYPRYTKADYEAMPEWKVDLLLTQYGLPIMGDLAEKRKFAMGAFLWPSQYK